MTNPTDVSAPDALVNAIAEALNALDGDWFGTPVLHVLDEQERLAYFDIANAALTAIEAAGWQCVPKESTQVMLDDGAVADGDGNLEAQALSIYTAMLSAAPKVTE